MKTSNSILITIGILLLTGCGVSKLKYPIPNKDLTSKELCGKKVCDPGNVGKLLHLTKSPFSPSVNIKKATSQEDIAIQVLGQTLPADQIRTSKDFSTCSTSSKNPFTSADIRNTRFPDGNKIEYEEKKKLQIDINAAANANIKELAGLTDDVAKIERLRAKIEAAYKRVQGKELTITGRYSEWELSQNAREQIKKGDGFQSCRQWIEDENQRIILSVGIIYFDISYEQNSLDDLAAEIDAELKKEGLETSLSFTFKKEITKRFSSKSEVYQIVIFRHAGIKGKSFVTSLDI